MNASEGKAAPTGKPAASPAGMRSAGAVSAARILKFFLPLGLSASLVTLSHVIINGTLARAPQPELVIAGYAIAFSIFGLTERPAVLLRQTGSALMRDRTGFRALGRLAFWLIVLIVLIGSAIAFTPLGSALIRWGFGADDRLVASALNAYGVIVFVSVFSALRCLYHGVLIRDRNTKWLTLGMLIRLGVMYAVSVIILETGVPVSGAAGSFIFLIGMATEAAFGYFEGRIAVRKLPERDPASKVTRARDIFPFYRPLVLSSFIAVIVLPAINVVLGKTEDMNLAIASYAVASSVTNLVLSFFSYSHQMALQFFQHDSRTTVRVSAAISVVPPVLVAVLAFTPAGYWLLRLVVGAEGQLLAESLAVLKFFLPYAALFAWVDFCQGLMMLFNQTNILVKSQAANVLAVIAALSVAIAAVPEWNGRIGALAMSAGYASELIVLLAVLWIFHKRRQLTTP